MTAGLMYLSDWQGKVVQEWWTALQRTDASSDSAAAESARKSFPVFDPGHRARLRRASSLRELVLEEAPHALFDRLQFRPDGQATGPLSHARRSLRWETFLETLPLIAGVVVHVNEGAATGNSLAYLIGRAALRSKEERPVLSELRFKRMMHASDAEALFQQLRRVLAMIRSPVDVAVLADDLLGWAGDRENHDQPSQSMHFRWARDYYLDSKTRKVIAVSGG